MCLTSAYYVKGAEVHMHADCPNKSKTKLRFQPKPSCQPCLDVNCKLNKYFVSHFKQFLVITEKEKLQQK